MYLITNFMLRFDSSRPVKILQLVSIFKMPKDRRLNFLSTDRARASPYACSSKDSNHGKLESCLPPVGDEKEWEEARCPICMEHPHNAVLLLCSSRDKGCRPYMCDTSHRHSNCLDQFCKSVAGASSTELQGDLTVSRMQYLRERFVRPTRSTGGQVSELLCPLCRGQISGWVVIEKARWNMNSKERSCSLESCNFTGNYIELRKHARREHPIAKPSDVDPERQSEWVRLERERDLGDTLSVMQSHLGHEPYIDDSPPYAPLHWSSDDETQDEWSENEMSVDLDVGVEFTFSFLNEFSLDPSEGARNSSSSARTGSRSLNRRSMVSRSRANDRGGITSPRRNTTTARLGSEAVRITGSERTGGRSLNRRSMRSRSRSNHQDEITFPRRRDMTPSTQGPPQAGYTGSERIGRRSFSRRSRSRSNHRADTTPPRRWDMATSLGSEWARNTGSARTGNRSLGGRSIASRSRWNTSSSRSDHWRYAE